MTMKTTPRIRECLRAAHLLYPLGKDQSEDILALLDDFATLEAELAALRRVEAEGLNASHDRSYLEGAWTVDDGKCFGDADSLTAALAAYDEMRAMVKKEQR